jgi:glyoxylase-like metal-dependent hydrolase (beta-lactamase superfamily II)
MQEGRGTIDVWTYRETSQLGADVMQQYGLEPQAVVTYVDEIKKVSNQPIKYLIYSHQHFDHIAGGKPFKDAGATIVTIGGVPVNPTGKPDSKLREIVVRDPDGYALAIYQRGNV